MKQTASGAEIWPYQYLYRLSLETIAQGVVTKLGLKLPVRASLVAVSVEERNVLVDTDDEDWKPGALDHYFAEYEHSLDELENKDCITLKCAENLGRTACRLTIDKLLTESGLGTVFVGYPALVENYLVSPVLRIPEPGLNRLPRPTAPIYQVGARLWKASDSLLDSALDKILEYAGDVLRGPRPGSNLREFTREYVDICRAAAKDFMYRVAWGAGARTGLNLFEVCNEIASLYNEGLATRGRLLFCHPDLLGDVLKVEFLRAVPITETGWSRKLVGVSSDENTLVVTGTQESGLSICGIGSQEDLEVGEHSETFVVDFTGHHKWQVNLKDRCLMHVRYGVPSIPAERMDRAYLLSLYKELFPESEGSDVKRILTLAQAAIEQKHGTMLVISSEAESEAARLESQGTSVKPTLITPELLRLVAAIDGAVILDPSGRCHGVGVILDGPATPEGSPARGARYNSAIRYTSAHPGSLIVVVSEDGPVDIFPKRETVTEDRLLEQLSRIQEAGSERGLDEGVTQTLLQWLNEHRAYFHGSQCGALDECVESLRERWRSSERFT